MLIIGSIIITSNLIGSSYALQQTANKVEFEIGPGESQSFQWGLITDQNISSTVEIRVEGSGSEFISHPKMVTLEPGEMKLVDFTITIPSDHKGGITITPELYALERGDEGNQVVVNNQMLKRATIKILEQKVDEPKEGGGCLIATAAYGSELAPQVQFLREIRDNTVMSTSSGAAFMTGFNQLYYSFSPTIADMERQNPLFQEAVRLLITPMLSTLSIMTLAEDGDEAQVLGLGISVIALNLGMYIASPTAIGIAIKKQFIVRK